MKLIKVLHLIRFPNLLLIAGVPFILRYGIMKPILLANGMYLQLSSFDFILLVLSSLCIAAAAYMINDYFDQRADWVNYPDKVILGNHVPRRWAIGLNFFLNSLAVLLGIYLSLKIHKAVLILGFLILPGLALSYSAVFKKKFWIGNWVAAAFVALVPMLVVVFEIPLLQLQYHTDFFSLNTNLNKIFYWMFAFVYLTFFTVLLYEGFKDTLSLPGDKESGCKTLPVLLPSGKLKAYFMVLILILLLPSAWLVFTRMLDSFTPAYFIALILIPLVSIMSNLYRKDWMKGMVLNIWILRFVMLAGILYPLFIHLQLIQ